jgi:hypothetical protein
MFIARNVVGDRSFQEALLGIIACQRFADSRMNEIGQTWSKAGASDNIACLSFFMNSKFNQNDFNDSRVCYNSPPLDDA